MTGHTISHFRILDKLGGGGMGVVYLAEDTKLDRRVALKLLPPHALASEDDRARFLREARAAAALNHPNIAHVYEIDESFVVPGQSGTSQGSADPPPGAERRPFIAMEFIDGETLADRIARGPLPLNDAVKFAGQVAEGLQLAHENGIVHRDVKPGNVMVTARGQAKILDFGLAKTAASTRLTQMGSTLGTVAYMSPEQARGDEVDHRSDVWSLGAVLYEMVSGRVPFPGDYEQAIVYGILNEEPEPLTAIRTGVPMALEWIVSKCMARDPDDRYQSARELSVDLRTADLTSSRLSRVSSSSTSRPTVPPGTFGTDPHRPGGTPVRKISIRITALLGLATLALGFAAATLMFRGPRETSAPVRHLQVELPGRQNISHPSLSPNGRYLAFTSANAMAQRSLLIYDMTNGDISEVPGSSGSRLSAFSPDSRWLVFERDEELAMALMPDGTPVKFADGSVAAWQSDGQILYQRAGSIYRKSIQGGAETLVAEPSAEDGEAGLGMPEALPGERRAIVTVYYRGDGTDPALALLDLTSGERSVLIEGASAGRYVTSGHLVYVQGDLSGQILAQPIEPSSGKLAGATVPVIGQTGFWTYAVGADGTLAYTGSEISSSARALYWISTGGDVLDSLSIAPQGFGAMAISPDGSLLAAQIADGADSGPLHAYHLQTGMLDPVNPSGHLPNWSADSKSLYFTEIIDGRARGLMQRIDRSRIETISDAPGRWISGVSLDERFVAFGESNVQNELMRWSDLYLLDRQTGQSVAIDTADWNHFSSSFSPDGNLIAYDTWTTETNWIVYVRDLRSGGLLRLSTGLGFKPQWSPDGRYIYYQTVQRLYRVAVDVSDGFRRLSAPELVHIANAFFRYTLHPRGERILIASAVNSGEDQTDTSVEMVLNWHEELRRIAPAGG